MSAIIIFSPFSYGAEAMYMKMWRTTSTGTVGRHAISALMMTLTS